MAKDYAEVIAAINKRCSEESSEHEIDDHDTDELRREWDEYDSLSEEY